MPVAHLCSVALGCLSLVACDGGRGEQLEAAQSEVTSLRAEVETLSDRLDQTEAKVAQLETRLAAAEARSSSRTTAADGDRSTARASGAIAVLKRAEAGDLSCPNPGECLLSRTLLEELLEDPNSLMDQVRIVPGRKDGAPHGFRVFAIRRDTPPTLLGFQNGDTILSVNGHTISSPDEALDAYAKLRAAETDALTFAVERGGKPVTIKIGLKDEL